jgi:hypothetical protein
MAQTSVSSIFLALLGVFESVFPSLLVTAVFGINLRLWGEGFGTDALMFLWIFLRELLRQWRAFFFLGCINLQELSLFQNFHSPLGLYHIS